MSLPPRDLRLINSSLTQRNVVLAIGFSSGGGLIFEVLILTLNIEEPKGLRTSVKISHIELDGNVIQDMAQYNMLDVVS